MNHSDSYTNFMNKGNMIKAKISMPSGFLDYNKLNSGEDKVKKNIQNLNPVGIKTQNSGRARKSVIGGLGSSVSKYVINNEKKSLVNEIVDE